MEPHYNRDHALVELLLSNILEQQYGPNHTIDILKECIRTLQPYAEKEREKTHA